MFYVAHDVSKVMANNSTVHAEIAGLNKIEKNNKYRKKIKVNVIVLRVTKTGLLGESKPCYHCIHRMANSKNVKIDKIIYSRSDGTCTTEKFSNLMKEDIENIHISKGNRMKFFAKHKLNTDKVNKVKTLGEIHDFFY